MAMIYSVREIARGGRGIGRYRHVGLSDEERNAVDELCDCPDGHGTREEAEACPKAKQRLAVLFGHDVESLRRKVANTRRDLTAAERELAEAEAREPSAGGP